jgi:hypothetical protein
VLDRLRRGEQAGVKGGRTLELLHDLLALVDHPVDGVTGFASSGVSDELENLLERRKKRKRAWEKRYAEIV